VNVRSIRFRLGAWYAALLVLLLMLFGGFVYLTLDQFLERNLQETLSKEAQTIGEALLNNVGETGEAFVATEIEEHFAPRTNSHFLRVMRADSSVLYQSGQPQDESFNPKDVAPVPISESDSWREQSLAGGRKLFVYSTTYATPAGTRYSIQAGASDRQINQALRGLLLSLALALPLIVGTAMGGGYLLMRKALKPLDEMATTAAKVTSRNLNERVPDLQTGDELEKLATSLNRMMSRLEESFQHVHRFSSDASHEIRTPLAILRGELENLLQVHPLPAAVRESLSSALEEAERLSRIVEQLLEVTRLEAGEALAGHSRFDVSEITRSTVEQMKLLADERHVALRFEGTQHLYVMCDPIRLRQVIVNLVDNAIKYTAPGGSVSVSSCTLERSAILEVADTGAGIPEEAIPYVFERFYRVDEARSRQLGGTGLGLAIVKSICIAFGGSVTVRSAAGSGTTFRVEFPLDTGTTPAA